jgi:hypothetical protein
MSTTSGKKVRPFALFLLAAFGVAPMSSAYGQAADWMVRREPSSGACHVQLRTAAPLGADLSGPFPSRRSACLDAANRYEAATTDPQKCGTYGGGTVSGCNLDGVTLPPK